MVFLVLSEKEIEGIFIEGVVSSPFMQQLGWAKGIGLVGGVQTFSLYSSEKFGNV